MPPENTPSRLNYAWFVVAILFPVALLNYLDRQMLATMKASMVGDIPSIANRADWGLVLGCFKWTYAILSPFGGYIADRFSRRHVIAGSLFVWSAVTWWTGHVTSFHELMLARALMGISEAFYIPAALAMIAEYHPGLTRSRAVGVHQTGIYIGQILGGFAGYIADSPEHGWRWAFTMLGMIGVVYAVPLLLALRNPPPATATPGAAATSRPTEGVLRGLLGNRNFLLLVLYFTLPAIAGWVVRDWMPDILREKFHLGQGKAGVSAILYVQIASMVGALVGGVLADRWMRTNARGRIYTSALGMALFLPALFSVGNAGTLSLAIVGLIVFGIGWGFFDCNNMPILCQIARPEWRATGYGIMNLVSISCGGFGDWAFGALRDRHMPLNLIFGVFAGVALLSVALVLAIRPRSEQTG
ncbi:MFS transporter [Opitutus sp. ER46]|uniref:MFS transporter n=1 Tax=Opitutus sp. ER46 TaxID=2161864 RepID=UPI000D310047|nr:MFS transporter [Opitutus sp. ER46]PTX97947.1 MFS transporter [Opitutus sp. ER46]